LTVNPLVAGRVDQPKSAWAGIWIAEDIELIARGVENNSWVDGTLGVVGAGLDALALVSDPVGALLQYGIAWLIEHVKPLSEALDWLAGDPAQISAHAQTWRNVAASLRTESDELTRAVRFEIGDWSGAASDAYRNWAGQRGQSLEALAKASDTLALMTEGAGMLIGTVRLMVRDAVATVVSRLIVYAGELIGSLGTAAPLVAEQATTLCASWAAKIARWLKDLISSMRNLLRESDKLERLIELLKRKLGIGPKSEAKEPQRGPASDEPEKPASGGGGPEPPDLANGEIHPNKIAGYAMNPDHPVGGHKYRVIHSVTGLDVGDAAKVEEQIRAGVRNATPDLGKADEFGQRWTVDLPLSGPKGTITVRTAWIVDAGSTSARLVTISLVGRNHGIS